MPSFNGDALRWSEFWDSFKANVDKNLALSNIEKLSYLNSKLHGEAKQAVSGIPLSNDNYQVAKTILKDKFGKSKSVVNSHYTQLMNLKPATNTTKGLRVLYDNFERHFRSLEAMQQDTNQDVFVPMLTSKIPKDVLFQLQIQRGANVDWTVTRLRELLNDYVSNREDSEQQGHTDISSSTSTARPLRSSTEALMVNQRTSQRQNNRNCRFCSGNHWSDECRRYQTVDERKQRIRGSCYICLKQGHKVSECGLKKDCVYCGQSGNHHRSLCQQKFGSVSQEGVHFVDELETEEDPSINENALLSSGELVMMQTATTDMSNPTNGQIQNARMLLDSGSQRTYISEALARKLKLKRGEESEIMVTTFRSEKPRKQPTTMTTIDIMLKGGGIMNISASIVQSICGSLTRRPIQYKSLQNWEHLWNEENLADSLPTKKENTTIELLIGNDYYLDFILPQKVEIQPGLYMLASKLGWILTGRTMEQIEESTEASMLMLSYNSRTQKEANLLTPDMSLPTKPNLEEFWKLETIGIMDSPVDSDDVRTLKHFNETLKYENNRYNVTWPWKDNKLCLPENRELAFGRLKSLINKLKNHPQLVDKYDDIIQNQLKLGVVEKVTKNTMESQKHYIPHHPVINPEKSSTKIRVVYDASAKTTRGQKSLNECLYSGPTMLQDLTGILLRFRLNKMAVVADIEKAFLQIGLSEEAKDVTRFFWLKDKTNLTVENNVQVYRFNRVPFGIICSPFLLAATLDHHLKGYDNSVATRIRENIYVDNVITGHDTSEEVVQFYREAKQIFSDASMNLRDWMFNSQSVMKQIPDVDKADQRPMKILGLTWYVESDMLCLGKPKPILPNQTLTKRNVLKRLASVYDPLGLFSPVTLQGKILLQSLWNKKISWDEQVPIDDQREWLKIDTDLQEIPDCKISRYTGPDSEPGIGNKTNNQLLVFCDASKYAYAAAVYLRQEDSEKVTNSLIFSKASLTPNKDISIPRLELLAAVIGVRCTKFVERELNVTLEQKHMWLDSQCVLSWIGSRRTFSTFVENRLKEIREQKEIKFHYIASSENPADMVSRGIGTKDLRDNDLWWNGPEWLLSPSDRWPVWTMNEIDSDTSEQENPEGKTIKIMYEAELVAGEGRLNRQDVAAKVSAPLAIDITRFSCLTKLLRVTVLVLRFINKLKRTFKANSQVDSTEIAEAEKMWTRYVQQLHYGDIIESIHNSKHNNMKSQLGIYLDHENILRCRGRLENAELSEGARLPMLLPKGDRYTNLLINRTHRKSFHAGVSQTLALVRQKYWIPQGRSAVRAVILGCSVCRHHEGGPYKMPNMPPLPAKRVTKSTPFSQCGVDYFGPLFIKSKGERKKVWVCLYTCLVTRAIHLELMTDMSTEQFLLGFRRFLARHGKPDEMISDNASQFKLASAAIDKLWQQILTEEDVVSYSASGNIKWKYIVELAPWMGGFYERLIGLVKRSLRKALGRLCLTYEQLLTILTEVEAVVNSRPLVYVGDDINSTITLTPSHFLTLNPRTGIPDFDNDNDDSDFNPNVYSTDSLLRNWKKGLKHLDRFWRIWRNKYLINLRERTETKLKDGKGKSQFVAQVGDVVLIKDDLPRGNWRLGRITNLIKSWDNHIRAAKVILPTNRVVSRPLNLLYPLECPQDRNRDNGGSDDEYMCPPDQPTDDNTRRRAPRDAARIAMRRIKEQLNL